MSGQPGHATHQLQGAAAPPPHPPAQRTAPLHSAPCPHPAHSPGPVLQNTLWIQKAGSSSKAGMCWTLRVMWLRPQCGGLRRTHAATAPSPQAAGRMPAAGPACQSGHRQSWGVPAPQPYGIQAAVCQPGGMCVIPAAWNTTCMDCQASPTLHFCPLALPATPHVCGQPSAGPPRDGPPTACVLGGGAGHLRDAFSRWGQWKLVVRAGRPALDNCAAPGPPPVRSLLFRPALSIPQRAGKRWARETGGCLRCGLPSTSPASPASPATHSRQAARR